MDYFDLFFHLDRHLPEVIQDYGALTYVILFIIVFCETGLVATPFLPGDSLLFTAGAFAALGAFDVTFLFLVLTFAAISGDMVNYWTGRAVGPSIFHKKKIPFLNKEHLRRTELFYERHGGKTIIIARFIPVIRTFAPFVAGIGKMEYSRFIGYNIAGGILWNAVFIFGGYYLGNLPVVKNNFTLVILLIILISFIPGIAGYALHHLKKKEG